MRCSDCHWFENAPPVGRKSLPCIEQGELAQNEACEYFREREVSNVPTLPRQEITPEKAKRVIGALGNESYHDIFREIIAESFTLEQDSRLAMLNVQAQLQQQGAEIVLDGDEYKRYADRLVDLYVLYRMACATGLGRWADDIVTAEISRKFGAKKEKKA